MDDRTELRVGWAMRMDRPAIPPDDGAVPSDACAVSPDEWLVRTDGRRDAPLTAERIRQTTVVKVEVVISIYPGNGMKSRDAARARENWFSTLSRTARYRLSAARGVFQQAAAIATAAGVGAEEMARRLTGVGNDVFQILPGGKTFAALPFADGGQREAEFGGHLFEGFAFVPPPAPKGVGKIPAEVTFDSRPFAHMGFQHRAALVGSRNFHRAKTRVARC